MSNINRYRRDVRLFKDAYRQWFFTKKRFDTRFSIRFLTRRRIILSRK